jgi:hypothetical protein
VTQDTPVLAVTWELGEQLLAGADFGFFIAGVAVFEGLQKQLLVTRQSRLQRIEFDHKLIAVPAITNKKVLIYESHVGEGKLRVQTDRLFQFADGVLGEKATAVVNAQLIVTIASTFDVEACSISGAF